ncbi:uncharacterized protein LOC134826521 [Bolinopsis microptera]|uniref:uncharacterized protein LOC134826521 n=1 Tax=Bolinopsis microptera TaxID=2820187 RepID=UPI003078E715
MDNYLKNGQEIFLKFCTSDDKRPTMLPRAPDQTYIDRYPESSGFRDQRKRQSDYEAEVMVYRALEKLPDGKIVVLHNFEFTHHQYCLCDQSHLRDKKTCKGCKNSSNKEGECDFLILCPGSIVIIEVKNMSHIEIDDVAVDKEEHFRALSGTFKKSVEQRKKIEYLIQCIDKDTTICQFTAYPNFSEQFKGQFQASEDTKLQLSDSELSTVIFHEDIVDGNKINDNNNREPITAGTSIEIRETSPEEEQNYLSRFFSCLRGCFLGASDTERQISSDDISSDEDLSSFGFWWNNNTTIAQDTRINHDAFQKVRNMLLAIWATDKNCDKSKCSLGNCISNIDERLKSGKFTFLPKKGKNSVQNPGVVTAPDVIRNFVKVENLTVEQYEAFESSENLLWINGPAGAGKSVILCGRIIKLVQLNEDNKVVLFKFGGDGNNCQLYQRALKNADVEYQETSMSDVTELVTLISESKCKVIIVEITRYDVQKLIDTISAVTNCHIFIDDIQELLYISSTEECSVLMDKLLSLECTVMVACDMAQGYWNLSKQN